jgi:predicted DNA-binding transcriptional regulator YafY
MRLDRLLAITLMLLNRDRISAAALAEHFEVSVRTIYRDIEALNLAGIPVVSYAGHEGGFGIMENYRIDRQMFSFKDMFSMLTALRGLNRTLRDKELDRTIEKITSLVPRGQQEQLAQQYEQLVIDIMPWGLGEKQKKKVATVQAAIRENRLLRFQYRNTRGEKLERTVEPMTLLFKAYGWYLFAYCRRRRDYRLFRLTRMNEPEILKETFARRPKTYAEVFQKETGQAKRVDLVLQFRPQVRHMVLDYFEEETIRVQKDGSVVARISLPEGEWVYGMILSYGENVRVLEPVHIQKIVQEKAQKILQNNAKQPER